MHKSCYLQLMLMLLYDSLNLVVSGVKLWTVTGPQLGRKGVESFVLQQLYCVHRQMHCCTVLLKDEIIVNINPLHLHAHIC